MLRFYLQQHTITTTSS